MSDKKNKKSGFIPYIFLVFFGVVFLVDLSYILIARKTSSGLYTKDSYNKGIAYNESINAVEKQQKLGWKIETKYQKIGKNFALITVFLRDKNGTLIRDAKLSGFFKRPTKSGVDFKQDFLFDSNKYFAKIKFPLKGVWDVEIRAFRNKEVFQKVKRYIIR